MDYQLAQLPARLRWSARAQLTLISLDEDARRPLSEKPRSAAAIEVVRAAIPNPTLRHLVPVATTEFDRNLALALGIPMSGADSRHAWLEPKAPVASCSRASA